MDYDIYLEKDGVPVAVCASYTASPYEGRYTISIDHCYATEEAIIRSIDICNMFDFQLVCEKPQAVIRYWIREWSNAFSNRYESNGRIEGLVALADRRTECWRH
mgnify:CR=1 FL=1